MPCTEAARREYRRAIPRCASDLSDREWALIAPFMPDPKRIGCPRSTDLREEMNAILCSPTTGCQWARLPKDLPSCSSVQRCFYDWRDGGLLQTIPVALAMGTRELEGREAQPTAGVIGSQSTESCGVCGYDAGKKIRGRKSHIVVDTIGLVFNLVVHAADIQDRDGAPAVPASIRTSCPWLHDVFADGGCSGRTLRCALDWIGTLTIEVVERSDAAIGFKSQPTYRQIAARSPAGQWMGRRAHSRIARTMPPPRKGLGEVRRVRRGVDQRRSHSTHRPPARKILLCPTEP